MALFLNDDVDATLVDIGRPPHNAQNISLAFSHVHMYVDALDDIETYKKLEEQLNELSNEKGCSLCKGGVVSPNQEILSNVYSIEHQEKLNVLHSAWLSITQAEDLANITENHLFATQKRDIVRQMIAGFGFRVIGARTPTLCFENDEKDPCSTISMVVTSRDTQGVQFVVSAVAQESDRQTKDDSYAAKYHHFDSSYIEQFYNSHAGRQGIAVLAFQVTEGSVEDILNKYVEYHPKLLVSPRNTHVVNYDGTKILDVYAYYDGESKQDAVADKGTMLRFIETKNVNSMTSCILPGFFSVPAIFDHTSQAAYCDHWVSNVISRTGFIDVLQDTLGFTPKVNFNAGVIAAGESQIESTVSGNLASIEKVLESACDVDDSRATYELLLRDQSQIYLPINNALSPVGHVNGFLQQLGQGVQHIASRVDNLIDFVQRANDYREITREGFTFLNIPRSYYGLLTENDITCCDLSNDVTSVSLDCADLVMTILVEKHLMTPDGAVNLSISYDELNNTLDTAFAKLDGSISKSILEEFDFKRECIIRSILRTRYKNVYNLLGDRLTESEYLGIVRNRILVDVQGSDILFQIFTCNILQRAKAEEAPFLEFIQRGCGTAGGHGVLRPGCGGFGIRNFLTLFLSIEVSKAMENVIRAEQDQDEDSMTYYQSMVDIFTEQLNKSNPILNEISNAMTIEGNAAEELKLAIQKGDLGLAAQWEKEQNNGTLLKNIGNQKLMECSEYYRNEMAELRSKWEGRCAP